MGESRGPFPWALIGLWAMWLAIAAGVGYLIYHWVASW